MRVVMNDQYGAVVEKSIGKTEAQISENLKWRKEALDMKLWQLSAAFGGMDLAALSRYINGKKEFSVPILVKFSSALGVDVADWFLPSAQFRAKYKGDDEAPFEVRVVPTAGSRSSSRSKAERGKKSTSETKVSPFCKPRKLLPDESKGVRRVA